MTPRESTITAPAPTNAFAPPPKVLDETADGGGSIGGRPLRPNELPKTVTVTVSVPVVVDASAPAPASAVPRDAAAPPVVAMPAVGVHRPVRREVPRVQGRRLREDLPRVHARVLQVAGFSFGSDSPRCLYISTPARIALAASKGP